MITNQNCVRPDPSMIALKKIRPAGGGSSSDSRLIDTCFRPAPRSYIQQVAQSRGSSGAGRTCGGIAAEFKSDHVVVC